MQVVFGITRKSRQILLIKPIPKPCYPHIEAVLVKCQMSTSYLHAKHPFPIGFRLCAMIPCGRDGSNHIVLDDAIHLPIRIKSRQIESLQQTNCGSRPTKIAVFIDRSMLPDACSTSISRSQRIALSQAKTTGHCQSLSERQLIIAQRQSLHLSHVSQQHEEAIVVVAQCVMLPEQRLACIFLGRKARLHIVAIAKLITHRMVLRCTQVILFIAFTTIKRDIQSG